MTHAEIAMMALREDLITAEEAALVIRRELCLAQRSSVPEQAYFDADGNEGTLDEVYS